MYIVAHPAPAPPPTALNTIINRFLENSNPNGVCPVEGVKMPLLKDPSCLTLKVFMILVAFSATAIQSTLGVKEILGASTTVPLKDCVDPSISVRVPPEPIQKP